MVQADGETKGPETSLGLLQYSMGMQTNVFAYSTSRDGTTPMEEVTGETPSTAEHLDLIFYNWVWYKDNTGVCDNIFGRWLGLSHEIGNLMLFWIMTATGSVTSQTTVQGVTTLELATAEVRERSKKYNDRISKLLKEDNQVIQETKMRFGFKIGMDSTLMIVKMSSQDNIKRILRLTPLATRT